jgi:hypothetical protein
MGKLKKMKKMTARTRHNVDRAERAARRAEEAHRRVAALLGTEARVGSRSDEPGTGRAPIYTGAARSGTAPAGTIG